MLLVTLFSGLAMFAFGAFGLWNCIAPRQWAPSLVVKWG